jgi:hypothetical protein
MNKCDVLLQTKNPEFSVLREYNDTDWGHTYTDSTLANCIGKPRKWEILTRPIVGDHIHIGYKLVIDNKDLILHDRNVSEYIGYEEFPATCKQPFAYEKTWYHNGAHTHCDGIIHIHPWSAPTAVRLEGRNINLGLWFESVGIEHTKRGFLFNGKYIKLNMAYYLDEVLVLETMNEQEIMSLWLVDHHAIVLLWDDKSKRPDLDEEFLKHLFSMESSKDYPKRVYIG